MTASVQRSRNRPQTDPIPSTDIDPEICAEQEFLARARTALALMHREATEVAPALQSSEDSDEIYHNTVYRMALARRVKALVDLPGVPLFFGRLDYEPGTVFEARQTGTDLSGVDLSQGARDRQDTAPETIDHLYIGRRHVHDETGDPLVIDWRAEVATAFYRASRADPQQIRSRRRYGFSDSADLTAYEEEILTGGPVPPGNDGVSDGLVADGLLTAEIERPRSGPMRDIVATIQPEQDDLVRAPLAPSLCIQGAPGTGKTAVGLHRLAYLLYNEPERLGSGVVVLGPNRSFLTYIRRVLPALGEVNITQTTADGLIGRSSRGPETDDRVARIKGDARLAKVLHRALWAPVGQQFDGLLYAQGAYRYRLGADEVERALASLRSGRRYDAGRTALAQRLAHLVLVQMEQRGIVTCDRTQNAVARSRPVKQLIDRLWPKQNPEQVLFRLLSDAEFLAETARGILTDEEQALLLWNKPFRSWRSARWSTADVALLDELGDLFERCRSLSHIVIDEAQDLSAMQCRAVGRRCVSGTVTVLGDIAQGTTPWAMNDWSSLLEHLGHPQARLAVLERGYRVPGQIIDFAARLLPGIAPGLKPPQSFRRVPGSLRVRRTVPEDLPRRVTGLCRELLDSPGSVGVIAADAELQDHYRVLNGAGLQCTLLGEPGDGLESSRLVCVPAGLAKGLEFDTVVVIEPARIVAAEFHGTRRLYVALTRAVSTLHVLHCEDLPEALRRED
jgi:DNA helicase IV